MEAYFMKGFACGTTHSVSKSKKNSFPKGAVQKKTLKKRAFTGGDLHC
jgi:hypothetical protein